MKKILIVSLLLVQGLWAAAAADRVAQQVVIFKTADGEVVTYQPPEFSGMINTMVEVCPASGPNEIVDLPGLTGAAFKLVLDLCVQMERNNGLFNNVPVGVINNNQNKLDHLIEAAYVLDITVGLEHFIKALFISWLNAHAKESIILVQNGLQACEKMNIKTGQKGKRLKQLTVDISDYLGPNCPIDNLNLRPGTIAYLIHTNQMPAIAYGILDLSNKALTVCDLWNIPLTQRQQITQLWLQDNQITVVQPNAFAGFNSLTFLAFSSNQITNVAAGAFAGLPTLESLFLDYNRVKTIGNDAFVGLSSLIELWLHGNDITDVKPNTFAGLPLLTRLWLDENKITDVEPNTFAGLPRLTQLLLINNAGLQLNDPDNLEALKAERPEWFGLPVGVTN